MIKILVRIRFLQKKNDLAHKNTSGPFYRAIKWKNYRNKYKNDS
jgi:hypothetical protein